MFKYVSYKPQVDNYLKLRYNDWLKFYINKYKNNKKLRFIIHKNHYNYIKFKKLKNLNFIFLKNKKKFNISGSLLFFYLDFLNFKNIIRKNLNFFAKLRKSNTCLFNSSLNIANFESALYRNVNTRTVFLTIKKYKIKDKWFIDNLKLTKLLNLTSLLKLDTGKRNNNFSTPKTNVSFFKTQNYIKNIINKKNQNKFLSKLNQYNSIFLSNLNSFKINNFFKINKQVSGLIFTELSNTSIVYKNTGNIFYFFLKKFINNKLNVRYRKSYNNLQKRFNNSIMEFVFFKNTLMIKNTIESFLYWRNFKKHKIILYLFRRLFTFNKSRVLGLYNFSGLKCILKGKLSSVGGAKKRKKTFFVGQTTTNGGSYSYLSNMDFSTPTGILNIKVFIN